MDALEPRQRAHEHYRLANAFREQGRLQEAEAHLQATVAITPLYAEAHNNLGAVQQLRGRPADAERSYRLAVQLKPALGQAHLNLGRLMMGLGRWGDAVLAYESGASQSDTPEVFAHLLAALAGRPTDAAPAGYVRATFEGYARQYDRHMVDALGYGMPGAMYSAVAELSGLPASSAAVLDLGCGTGLVGASFAALARKLVGVDLCPEMLDVARERQCYDELVKADIREWLRAQPPGAFDVVTASDVFIYIGNLDGVFGLVARVLRAGGLFAFSVEVSPREDWELHESGRYRHSEAYLARLAGARGFTIAYRASRALRHPLSGQLYVLRSAGNG